MIGFIPSILSALTGDALVVGGITGVAYLADARLDVDPGERVGPEFLQGEDGEVPALGDWRFLAGVGFLAANALGLPEQIGRFLPIIPDGLVRRLVDFAGFGSLAAWGVNEAQRAAAQGTLPFVGIEAPKFLTGGSDEVAPA